MKISLLQLLFLLSSLAFGIARKEFATGPLKVFLSTIKDAQNHLAAAAFARGTSILAMFPVDTIKTRMQLSDPKPFQLNGLFNGVGVSLLGQVPYGVLTFGSYEVYKENLQKNFQNWNPAFHYALAAVGGDLTGSIWLCPSEVVKSKVQAGLFANSLQACRHILRTKGLGGFYQGFLGLAARDIPFRVCQLTSYEIVKSLYLKSKTYYSEELSPVESAFCGAIAGSFSAAVTTPLDRIKSLLAVGTTKGTSVVGVASMILKEEGPIGFTKGLGPRLFYVAPSVTIFFIVYEYTQQRFRDFAMDN